MGISVSTQMMNAVNSVTNNVAQKIESNCSASDATFQNILVNIELIDGCHDTNITAGNTIDAKYNSSCTQSSISSVDIQTALKNALEAKFKSDIGAYSLSTSVNQSYQNIENYINSNAFIEQTSQSINNAMRDQNISADIKRIICRPIIEPDGSIKHGTGTFTLDLTNNINSNFVAKVLQSNQTLTKLAQELDNAISSDITQKVAGLNDVINALMGIYAIIALVMIFVMWKITSFFRFGGLSFYANDNPFYTLSNKIKAVLISIISIVDLSIIIAGAVILLNIKAIDPEIVKDRYTISIVLFAFCAINMSTFYIKLLVILFLNKVDHKVFPLMIVSAIAVVAFFAGFIVYTKQTTDLAADYTKQNKTIPTTDV
jgi:hypothetical protein